MKDAKVTLDQLISAVRGRDSIDAVEEERAPKIVTAAVMVLGISALGQRVVLDIGNGHSLFITVARNP